MNKNAYDIPILNKVGVFYAVAAAGKVGDWAATYRTNGKIPGFWVSTKRRKNFYRKQVKNLRSRLKI